MRIKFNYKSELNFHDIMFIIWKIEFSSSQRNVFCQPYGTGSNVIISDDVGIILDGEFDLENIIVHNLFP